MEASRQVSSFIQAWCEIRIDARIEEKRLFEAHEGFCVLNNLVPLTTEFFFAAFEVAGSLCERRDGYVLGLDVRHTFSDWISVDSYETRSERERRLGADAFAK